MKTTEQNKKDTISLLYLEDNPLDIKLLQAHFEDAGFSPGIDIAGNRKQFFSALKKGGHDLFLFDYSLPDFDGISAMKAAKERFPDKPVIILSGTIGEEVAVETLKLGASDYVMKNKLSRIVPAIKRALREAKELRKRKEAEQALRESEEKYRSLVESSGDAIYLLFNEKFELINRKFKEIFKLTEEDIARPGFSLMQLVAPRSKEQIDRRKSQLEMGKKLDATYHFTALTGDGREIEVEASTARIKYRDGTATQGIIRDITEKKILEEQLRQAQKMESIGRLAGGVAHDFNNLLTVIRGYVDLIMDDMDEKNPLHSGMQEIKKASDRAANLTRQLLAFSRKQIMQMEIIDVNDALNEVSDMLRRLIGEDVLLKMELAGDPCLIMADRGQLVQIVTNLLINARDAMPEGGEVRFKTALVQHNNPSLKKDSEVKEGTYVKFSISDTGSGIDQTIQNKVFDPFFTTKEAGRGTGLGLSTVYGIVRQWNGFIRLSSQPGRGATFNLFFPAL